MNPKHSLLLVLFVVMTAVSSFASSDSLQTLSNEELIDQLTLINAPAPGLHPTAMVGGFIGDAEPLKFEGGVLGSTKPTVSPAMKELARRGPVALPELIAHLGDKRPTGLVIETGMSPTKGNSPRDSSGGFGFTAGWFSDEYDPKELAADHSPWHGKELGGLPNRYTVKVGDVCYAIIGQIVGRQLVTVRYQPSSCLVINSPVETLGLAERVKKDWGGVTSEEFLKYLLKDLYPERFKKLAGMDSVQQSSLMDPATLSRLKVYYPSEYTHLMSGSNSR